MTVVMCRQVAVAAVAAAALTAGCGGSSPPRSVASTPPSSAASSAGVTLTPPSGWAVSLLPGRGGVVVADTTADLTATALAGPRLVVVPAGSAPTAQALVNGLDRSHLFSPTVGQQTFGRYSRVPVLTFTTAATTASGDTVEMIPMTVAAGRSYVFTLAAPSPAWSTAKPTLEAVVSAAVVKVADFPG